jgi:hypothetical protein
MEKHMPTKIDDADGFFLDLEGALSDYAGLSVALTAHEALEIARRREERAEQYLLGAERAKQLGLVELVERLIRRALKYNELAKAALEEIGDYQDTLELLFIFVGQGEIINLGEEEDE